MATRKQARNSPKSDGFDITEVIGSVRFDPKGNSTQSPYMLAMEIIAGTDREGTFSFPLENGQTQHVTIERSNYDGNPDDLDSPVAQARGI